MVFAFAISNGLEPTVRSFSIANHIGGRPGRCDGLDGALRGGARLTSIYVRTHQLTATAATPTVALSPVA
jgi:hypothetical protein